jgi:hypothetical protein
MRLRFLLALTAPLTSVMVIGCGSSTESKIQEAPDRQNRSDLMGVPIEKLANLKSHARLSRIGWSGDYWPTVKGGIADRWQKHTQGSRYQDFLYPIKSEQELRGLTGDDWDHLSPAEKFDISQNHLDFPLTRAEHRRTIATADASGDIPFWYGLCHGWAPAALLEREPGSKATVSGPFGKKVHFFSADIKALITKVYADANVENYFLGGRCNEQVIVRDAQGRALNPACRDANPASLHLVLANFIGEQRKGFVADISSDYQVWNQPVIGYKFAYSHRRALSADRGYRYAAPGTVELVNVDLDMEYLVEGQSSVSPIAPVTNTSNFNYTLELDAQGFVIGGEWISQNRPDFLWQLRRKPRRAGDSSLSYEEVKKISDLSRSH